MGSQETKTEEQPVSKQEMELSTPQKWNAFFKDFYAGLDEVVRETPWFFIWVAFFAGLLIR